MTLLNVTFFALTIAYPFIVYLTSGTPRAENPGSDPAGRVRHPLSADPPAFIAHSNSPLTAWMFFGLASFAVIVFAMNSNATLLYYPVLINVILFVLFGVLAASSADGHRADCADERARSAGQRRRVHT